MTKSSSKSIDARVVTTLSSLGVKYEQNKIIFGRSFDFFVPSRHLFIDVSGPGFKIQDLVNGEIQKRMDRMVAEDKRYNVESHGYQYLRIAWGEDIEQSIRACLE